MNISEIRKKYPQYKDMTDTQIAQGFHQKFYSDIPYEEFAASIGIKPETSAMSLAQNLGAGVLEGFAAAPPTPQDVAKVILSGGTYALEKLGAISPEKASSLQKGIQAPKLEIPTPAKVGEMAFNTYVRPQLPQASTTPEQYVRTIGQFAPAVISPGSAARRAAAVVVPAVASETAGQLTEGSAYEPWARLAGGLVGSRVAAPRTTAIRETAKLAPTKEQLGKDVTKAYDDFRSTGAIFDKTAFQGKIRQLRSELVDADFDEAAPVVFKKVDRMLRLPQDRITPGLLDKKYSELGDILADATESDTAKKAAAMARQQIMDIVSNSPVKSTTGVTGPELAASVKKARELAAAKFKAEDVEKGIDVGQWYQSGDISGIRNQLSNLGKSLAKRSNMGWTEIELEALKNAAKGTITTNFLNLLGKMGFQFGKGSGQTAAIPFLSTTFGGPLGIALATAGTAARPAAKLMTQKQVRDLQKVLMAGKTGQAAGIAEANRMNTDALIRQLISSGQAMPGGLLNEEQ